MPKQRPEIKEKYEGIYKALLEAASATISANEGDGPLIFARLKRQLYLVWAAGPEFRRSGIRTVTPDQLESFCENFGAAACSWTERGISVTGDNAGLNEAQTRVMVATVKKYVPDNCDAVIDIGCGWGHRLFDLWLNGGPQGAQYWGGERASEGRNILDSVAQLFPVLKAKAFEFDFLTPSFSAVSGDPRAVLIYTFHAVEQIMRVGREFFDAIINRFPKAEITGVHLEPCGFQMHGSDSAWRADREYALKKHYNLDLFEQISSHPKLKIIETETGLLDQGLGNSTSSLVWRYTP